MSRIFISHSSKDNDAAVKLRDWLAANGWDDVFLDFDPERGIVAGDRWQEALRRAADRCEAVLFLLSANWLSSAWCLAELTLTKQLGKRIFPIIVGTVAADRLPLDVTEHQMVDLVGDANALSRLKDGLVRAGLDPSTFPVPERRRLRPAGSGPYPGLEPLTEDDAAIFFGREAHIIRGLDRLRSLRDQGVAKLMVILGASGAGKSSYLRAGLWPRLKRDDRAFFPLPVIRPERAALSGSFGLYHALQAAMAQFPQQQDAPKSRLGIRSRIESDPAGLASLVTQLAEAARRSLPDAPDAVPPTVILAIDQGEELFNADGGTEAERFMSLLAATLERDAPLLAVIAIRSDAFPRLQNEPRLLAVDKDTVDLPPMAEGNYRTVIKGPADLVGLEIAPDLLEALLRDVGGAGSADALPLLAFTMERLYGRYGADGALSLAAYQALNGIGGAITAAIDQVLDEARHDPRLPDSDLALLPLLRAIFIPHLVRVNEAGEFTRRVAALSEIPGLSRPLADLLVAQRLLVKDRRQAGTDGTPSDNGKSDNAEIVEVAHEALLREWPQLAQWLREEREFLMWRGQLEAARRQWETIAERERDQALLVGRALSIAQGWTAARGADLPAADIGFITASTVAAERRRRGARRIRNIVVAAMAVLTVGAVAGGIYAWRQSVEARAQTKIAEQQRGQARRQASIADRRRIDAQRAQSRYLADLSRQETDSGDAATGALLALEALPKRWPHNERPYVAAAEDALYAALFQLREQRALRGHRSSVTSAAFSPDGKRIATASFDGTARVWDAKTGAQVLVLRGHAKEIWSVAFSPDGSRLATASTDKTARIWDAKTGALQLTLRGHDGVVQSVAFSPDSTHVVTAAYDDTARIWDAKTGASVAVLRGHDAFVISAAFSPDGSRIVTASYDKTIRIWDAKTGAELKVIQGRSVFTSAAFSPDGTRIVTASDDKTARVWDAQSGAQLAVLRGHTDFLKSASFSRDGTRIVTASHDGTARLWDAKTGAPLAILRANAGPVDFAAFSPDGDYVVTASDDGTARIWRAKSSAQLVVLRGHEGPVASAAFGPDGARIVTASWDRTARIWNATTGAQLVVLRGHDGPVWRAAFSPDGTRIVTASRDKTVRIWDTRSGAQILVLRGHGDTVWSAVFSPDGARIVTASGDHTARIWDANTGALLSVLRQGGSIASAAFSPDGRRIVTASWDKTARIWNAASGAPMAVLAGHALAVHFAAFSPDGLRIVTASLDRTARLWDAATGAQLAVLRGHSNWVTTARFSPDGARIVTASRDDTARVWNAKTGAPLFVLRGHDGAVSAATYSPDGNHIATASSDGTARVWRVFRTTPVLIAYARKVLPRHLTSAQRTRFHLAAE